jgi:L-threonylcarbamoyladenylate synthase
MTFTLSDGDLIVYPTSTLPGLGCLPTKKGLDNLYSTKNRPATMPVSLGVSRLEQAEEMVVLPDFISEFLDSFPRGGITTILPARQKVDPRLGGENIAIRVFSHPSAIELAEKFGPITATSANESGISPECNTEIAAEALGVDNFIPGICPNGLGSTFVKFDQTVENNHGWMLTVMREGVIPSTDVVECWTNLT